MTPPRVEKGRERGMEKNAWRLRKERRRLFAKLGGGKGSTFLVGGSLSPPTAPIWKTKNRNHHEGGGNGGKKETIAWDSKLSKDGAAGQAPSSVAADESRGLQSRGRGRKGYQEGGRKMPRGSCDEGLPM